MALMLLKYVDVASEVHQIMAGLMVVDIFMILTYLICIDQIQDMLHVINVKILIPQHIV